jgi:hypothetical protein
MSGFDKSLPVLDKLPEGLSGGSRERYGIVNGIVNGELSYYHFCPDCDGWIPGQAIKRREDTIRMLSGRRGIVYCCCRCGAEISFFGIIS